MIYVKGGRFHMGDFGPLVGEKLPFSPDQDNKPLHWVELSDYKIPDKKVTWKDFNKWLLLNGRDNNEYYKWATQDDMSEKFKKGTGDNYPAVASWDDAAAFFQWVGAVSGRRISLPTEAQWEYAARSRGQFRQFANSDNQYNPDAPDDKLNFTHDIAPVGSYPPNPLGLYDMMGNGHDWIIDWYSKDYYQHSPVKDPQGPKNGNKKVTRGYLGSMFGVYAISRGSGKVDAEYPKFGFRCAEN